MIGLKNNRPAAYDAAVGFFETAHANGFRDANARHARTDDEAHGRVEIREAWSIPTSACPLPGAPWPWLKSITFIQHTRAVKAEVSRELHAPLGSLPPTMRRITASAREDWEVKVRLHWRLDVQMREGRCTVHNVDAATALASMRAMALALLKKDGKCLHGKWIRGISSKQAKARVQCRRSRIRAFDWNHLRDDATTSIGRHARDGWHHISSTKALRSSRCCTDDVDSIRGHKSPQTDH